ncbi:MAG: hypothetical protein JWN73_3048 [Betaproteobacteria bacterium]|nr:hypothetical protein [Betaproteobacteria bacterium]
MAKPRRVARVPADPLIGWGETGAQASRPEGTPGAPPVARAAKARPRKQLEKVRIFAGVPWAQIEPVLARCPLQTLPAGTILLRPGEQNDAIHVLLAGLLHIRLESADSPDFIAIEPGGCIGELSIIDGKPASAYVAAAEDCEIMRIHADTFWDELIPLAGVARNMLKVLSNRMRLNNDLIVKRLADRLKLEHLTREFQTASGIQASMLPSHFPLFPDRAEVDLHAMMRAAREVGGDFYDAFFISPSKLFVAIGDVSGKGVPAALFMARSMTLMRMEALRDRPPHEILARVNDALCVDNDAGMFVTVFCGVLDTDTGLFAYSNGGHNPPLCDAAAEGYAYMRPPRGLVLGFSEGAPFGAAELRLRPGNSILLYTDGVTEAANAGEEMYSDERLVHCLRTLDGAASAREVVAAVCADVEKFVAGAEPSDDITVLALTYRGYRDASPHPQAAAAPVR